VERTILPPDDPPVARLSVSPTAVDVGQVVTLDASESTDDHGITQYAFTCDADGPVTANTAPTATCVYESGGDHEPAVTVTDTRGNTASSSQTLTVTIPPTAPTAAVTATPSQVRQGVRVTVDASGSLPGQGATITSYTFTCGTQAALPSQTSSQATCRFPRTGDERVQVRVTNDLGLSTTAATDVHVVTGLPPTARITVSPRIGRVGRPLHVDASTSRGTAVSHIVRYRYRCGSHPPTSWGTRSTTVCRFSRPGRARVTAWVRSDLGLIDQTVKTVRIRR
jgi:hypothetical protein